MAGAVLYQQAGRTLARELAAEVSNPRTPSQMKQRVKWANLVAFYRANSGWMAKAFESKKATQSDYNKFMSANVAASNIYLTKQEAAQGACVVGPFKITEGSLPPIEHYAGTQTSVKYWITNIYLSQDVDFGNPVTVGELSRYIVAANAGIKEGDQLSFIRCTQTVSNITGVPYLAVRAYEMVIDSQASDLVQNYLPTDVLNTYDTGYYYALRVDDNGKSGAFAMVLSRTVGGKTMVSTQSLQLVNMDTYLQQFTSARQLQLASESYGTSEDIFLDSKTAKYSTPEGEWLSPLTIKIGDKVYKANDYIGAASVLDGKRLEITFNKSVVDQGINKIYFGVEDESFEVNVASSGNMVYVNAMQVPQPLMSGIVYNIDMALPDGSLTIPFATTRPELD